MSVKVSSPDDFRGYKLGLVERPCPYDAGIIVRLTKPRHEGVADPICIQTAKGHTIEILNEI